MTLALPGTRYDEQSGPVFVAYQVGVAALLSLAAPEEAARVLKRGGLDGRAVRPGADGGFHDGRRRMDDGRWYTSGWASRSRQG